jgi:hypothetical protein
MNRKRIFSKIKGIVDFSELGEMINTPIKRYLYRDDDKISFCNSYFI